jgi:hypothetical protein
MSTLDTLPLEKEIKDTNDAQYTTIVAITVILYDNFFTLPVEVFFRIDRIYNLSERKIRSRISGLNPGGIPSSRFIWSISISVSPLYLSQSIVRIELVWYELG